MCETLLNHYENNSSILDNIWFSDEAVFHLAGRVNRYNSRIWRTENPKVIEEKERDSPKLVVWCAISSKGIIGRVAVLKTEVDRLYPKPAYKSIISYSGVARISQWEEGVGEGATEGHRGSGGEVPSAGRF